MNWKAVRSEVDLAKVGYLADKKRVTQEKEELAKLQVSLKHTEKAQTIAQDVAQQLQKQAHFQISGVVSLCLKTVFGEGYGFRIGFEKKRGRTEASLIVTKNGHDVEDPINEDSGGVVDVASFALRISCLLLRKPPLRRILILDEPFKSLSVEYRPSIKMLLEKLSEDFDLQIILATHMTELHAGKVISL